MFFVFVFFKLQNIFIVKTVNRGRQCKCYLRTFPLGSWISKFPSAFLWFLWSFQTCLLIYCICCFETNTNPSDSKSNQNKNQDRNHRAMFYCAFSHISYIAHTLSKLKSKISTVTTQWNTNDSSIHKLLNQTPGHLQNMQVLKFEKAGRVWKELWKKTNKKNQQQKNPELSACWLPTFENLVTTAACQWPECARHIQCYAVSRPTV